MKRSWTILSLAFLVLTGCTAADKDYVRTHVVRLKGSAKDADMLSAKAGRKQEAGRSASDARFSHAPESLASR